MAHAAAAMPLRRPFLLSLKPTRLLSCLAPPSPGIRHPRALRPAAPLPSDAEDADLPDARDGVAVSFKKSRNDLKREARRAVQWGMELAKFSPPQIKRILRAASLEREVFDALMTVKRFGPDVREGRRRQYNYIGSLLRSAQPELMDTLIQASKDGDDSKLKTLFREDTSLVDEDLPEEEECDEECLKIADRWFEGLLCKDLSVTNEVYAVHNVEFDRQEEETIDHLLVACVFSRQFWFHLLRQVGLHHLSPQPADQKFMGWWRRAHESTEGLTRQGLNSVVILAAWIILESQKLLCFLWHLS